jgi:hypothetical protein
MLLELKRRVGHGRFEKMAVATFPFKKRMCRYYMRFADYRFLLEPLTTPDRQRAAALTMRQADKLILAHEAKDARLTGVDLAETASDNDARAVLEMDRSRDESAEQTETTRTGPVGSPLIDPLRDLEGDEESLEPAQYELEQVEVPGLPEGVEVLAPVEQRALKREKQTATPRPVKVWTRLGTRIDADYQQIVDATREVRVYDLPDGVIQKIRDVRKTLGLMTERLDQMLDEAD